MTWWVLKYLDNDRDPTSLTVLARTPERCHMFIRWWKVMPRRHMIYRNIRGATKYCGWKYFWAESHCHEQKQPGYTYEHLFGPIPLDPHDHVWYYLFSMMTAPPMEHQGPLIHVPPFLLYTWTPRAYVGTKLKGIFHAPSFTGPLGPDPVWHTQNEGLHSLNIWQLEPDPMGLLFGIYALAGPSGNRTLYKRIPDISPEWIPRLTTAQCLALTGAASGEMCWVATNRTAIQQLYVLFSSALGDVGVWCIKSIDSGLTWNAYPIYTANLNYNAGNISVGFAQGTSPHPRGSVLYAVSCYGLYWKLILSGSTDWGETWTTKAATSMQLTRYRCLVDPTDHSIVYTGAMVNLANPQELFRSTEHGANLVEVDGIHHLGIYLEPPISSMWIHQTDHNWLTTLSNRHLWTTLDYCANWTDHGETYKRVERLHILSPQPEHLYLARNQSAYPPVHPSGPHVLYISDDYGATMHGKAGAHPEEPDGAGDSIPYDCGGICLQGMQLFPLH